MALDAAVPCSCDVRGVDCTHADGEAVFELIGSWNTVQALWTAFDEIGASAAALRAVLPGAGGKSTDAATCEVCLQQLQALKHSHPAVHEHHKVALLALEIVFRAAVEHGTRVEWV